MGEDTQGEGEAVVNTPEDQALQQAQIRKLESDANKAVAEEQEITRRGTLTFQVIVKWAVAGVVVAGLITAWLLIYLKPILTVESEIAKKESEIAKKESEIAALNNKLLESQQKRLEVEKSQLEADKALLKQDMKTVAKERDTLRQQNDKLNKQLSEQAKQSAEEKAKLEKRATEAEKRSQGLESTQDERIMAREEVRRLRAEADRLNQQIVRTKKAAQEAAQREKSLSFRMYRVRWGDTLERIAVTIYGDKTLWPEIARANGLLTEFEIRALRPGMVLLIPSVSSMLSNEAQ